MGALSFFFPFSFQSEKFQSEGLFFSGPFFHYRSFFSMTSRKKKPRGSSEKIRAKKKVRLFLR